MEPRFLRLIYAIEFLVALIAVFVVWSEIGGQTHLDLMAWFFKLFFGPAMAYAIVRATAAAVAGERGWNAGALRWLGILAVLAIAAGLVTYYHHLYVADDQEGGPPAPQAS